MTQRDRGNTYFQVAAGEADMGHWPVCNGNQTASHWHGPGAVIPNASLGQSVVERSRAARGTSRC